ncbi:MAG: cytochrome b/b6 domain-containing protein [Thiolinea sp.]
MKQNILVWDWPTRVFHWAFALSFAGAYLTSESERYSDWHMALGYLFAGLLVFRLVWGFIGGRYARFGSFMFGPSAIMAYLKSLTSRQPTHFTGHNPIGGIAIFLLLGLGALIAVSGVGLDFEIGGYDGEELFEELHEFAANLMLLLVFVHIVGVLVSGKLHGENLARSMVTGYKQGAAELATTSAYTWLGVSMLVLSLGFLFIYLN